MNTLLSICIPTFNRKEFLAECLYSIDFISESVEVLVSNNGSTDGTNRQYIDNLKLNYPVKYLENNINIGPERNFQNLINKSSGKYCMIMGDDDLFKPKSIEFLVSELMSNNSNVHHFSIIEEGKSKQLAMHYNNCTIDDLHKFHEYYRKIEDTSLFFTFISSFVFKKEIWDSTLAIQNKWLDTFYLHTYILHNSISVNPSINVIQSALVVSRKKTSNIINIVPGKFMDVDVKTFVDIDREFYGGNGFFLSIIRNSFMGTYGIKYLLSVSLRGGSFYLIDNFDSLIRIGYNKLLIVTIISFDNFIARKVFDIFINFIRINKSIFKNVINENIRK